MQAAFLISVLAVMADSGVTEDVIARTKKFEESIAHMYLDPNGFVTIGVGHLLADADAAVPLGLVKKMGGGAASDAEKKQEWETIHEKEAGYKASYYDKFANLKLPEEAINALLKSDLADVEKQLRTEFPDYDSYPQKAKAGLLDLGFNVGVKKLATGFPNFVKAVKAKDWKTAAKESHRMSPVPEKRNEEIKKLFEEAAGG